MLKNVFKKIVYRIILYFFLLVLNTLSILSLDSGSDIDEQWNLYILKERLFEVRNPLKVSLFTGHDTGDYNLVKGSYLKLVGQDENNFYIEFLDRTDIENEGFGQNGHPHLDIRYGIKKTLLQDKFYFTVLYFNASRFIIEGSFQKFLDSENSGNDEDNNGGYGIGYHNLIESDIKFFGESLLECGININLSGSSDNTKDGFSNFIVNNKNNNHYSSLIFGLYPEYDINFKESIGNYVGYRFGFYCYNTFGWNNSWAIDTSVFVVQNNTFSDSTLYCEQANLYYGGIGILYEKNIIFKEKIVGLFCGLGLTCRTLCGNISHNNNFKKKIIKTEANTICGKEITFGIRYQDIYFTSHFLFFNIDNVKGLSNGAFYLDFEAKMPFSI